VGVRFQPATLGAASGTVSAGTTCMALVLHGTGMPACTTSPNLFDFGKVEIGNSAEATFRIRNESARTLSGTVASSDTAFVVIGLWLGRRHPHAAGWLGWDGVLLESCVGYRACTTGDSVPPAEKWFKQAFLGQPGVSQ